jgi:cytochrome c oxidase accessory protein FixG
VFLTWLLIIAALSLFFFTALAGRLWCGYACPQTVWTEAFVWIERLVEGSHTNRKKLDKGPWTAEKVLKKSTKQFLWLSFAFLTGLTFVGYFTPIKELTAKIIALDTGPWETFWVVFYGFATYGNAAFLREQVCKYMCPYARFQSAMFDRDTLIISYDAERGEPRGSRKRGAPREETGLGDCINCTLCVQACPTGIDIRDGLQYECIACAACIDACDSVMEQVGYPKGLIKYTTQNAMDGKTTHVIRPRMAVYATLLAALCIGFIVAISMRSELHLDVLRDRNALYREMNDGQVENVYTIKVQNKSQVGKTVELLVTGLPNMNVETDPAELVVEAGELQSVTVRIQVAPEDAQAGGNDIVFAIRSADSDKVEASRKSRFVVPLN